jgi:hypothetical protein
MDDTPRCRRFHPTHPGDPNTRIDEPLTVENGPEDQPEKPDFSRSFNPVKLFEGNRS